MGWGVEWGEGGGTMFGGKVGLAPPAPPGGMKTGRGREEGGACWRKGEVNVSMKRECLSEWDREQFKMEPSAFKESIAKAKTQQDHQTGRF